MADLTFMQSLTSCLPKQKGHSSAFSVRNALAVALLTPVPVLLGTSCFVDILVISSLLSSAKYTEGPYKQGSRKQFQNLKTGGGQTRPEFEKGL